MEAEQQLLQTKEREFTATRVQKIRSLEKIGKLENSKYKYDTFQNLIQTRS